MRSWAGAAAATVFLVCGAVHALEVPFLSGRVVDQAALIDPATRGQIETRLATLEQATGAQIAVLTVPTLDDDPIEDFAIRVLEAWELGRKNIDDGALFVIAPAERQMRIEVGYGLEPTLTDATARRILDEIVAPRFQQGDMAGGILAGASAIADVAEGSELPAPEARRRGGESVGYVFFFAVVVLFWLVQIARRYRGEAVWTSDHGWGRRRSRHHGGPWWWGGGGGGGGGGGFGGFSGGGGSFGGGGASSSW